MPSPTTIGQALARPSIELHDGQCPDCANVDGRCRECFLTNATGVRECEECDSPHEDGGVLLTHVLLDGGESYLCRHCYEWIDDRLAAVESQQATIRRTRPLECSLVDVEGQLKQSLRDRETTRQTVLREEVDRG